MAEKGRQDLPGIFLDEGTIFDRSAVGRTGYELPPLEVPRRMPTELRRQNAAELPELGELDVVRHFTRLSSWNFGFDLGSMPMGFASLKYQPRIAEELARLPGFANVHPHVPLELGEGALEVFWLLEKFLCEITGLDDCSARSPAGMLGKAAGLAMIRRFHADHGSFRNRILVPERELFSQAPACRLADYEPIPVMAGADGLLSIEIIEGLIQNHGREIAGLLFTNPNYQGLFESQIVETASLLHGIGAQVYLDGSSLSSLLGVARPRDMGVDLIHWDLHQTFATPLSGEGPDAGPLIARAHLGKYLPCPRIQKVGNHYMLEEAPSSVGRVSEGLGGFAAALRGLSYILSQGSEGLKRMSRASVLNTSYVRRKLSGLFHLAEEGSYALDKCVLDGVKITPQDKLPAPAVMPTEILAKALLGRGFHPPAMAPGRSGALAVEPTETESLQELDRLVEALSHIARAMKNGEDIANAGTKTIVGEMGPLGAVERPVFSVDDRT